MRKIRYLIYYFLFFIFSLGCRVSPQFRQPEKQFVYIKSNISILACHVKTNICVPANSGMAYASGFLIDNQKHKSYFLTAGHVCEYELESKNTEFRIAIEKEIHLLDHDEEDLIASVVAVDKEHDICLLSTKKVHHLPAKMAKRSPLGHSKVINVAAPAGIWSKSTMLHFDGEFQGNRLKNGVLQSIYVLTAQPGSSGSPIYDPSTGRVVGMVTHVLGPSFSISFGPTTEQLNSFLNKNLPK